MCALLQSTLLSVLQLTRKAKEALKSYMKLPEGADLRPQEASITLTCSAAPYLCSNIPFVSSLQCIHAPLHLLVCLPGTQLHYIICDTYPACCCHFLVGHTSTALGEWQYPSRNHGACWLTAERRHSTGGSDSERSRRSAGDVL